MVKNVFYHKIFYNPNKKIKYIPKTVVDSEVAKAFEASLSTPQDFFHMRPCGVSQYT